jgi:hypothetical protein
MFYYYPTTTGTTDGNIRDDAGKCVWAISHYVLLDYGVWKTGCGKSWMLNDGTPTENGMRYCPFCGREIAERNQP